MYKTPNQRGRSPSRKGNHDEVGETYSPNVRSRAMEKEELSGLNDRLATYIDRMRNLEHQNAHLTAEIQSSRNSNSRELSNLKAMYENELSDARKMIDESANEKNVLQLDKQKLLALVDELQKKLDKETKSRSRADDEVKRLERRLNEKESHLLMVSKERKQLDDRVKELEVDLGKIEEELQQQKRLLENEIIRRVCAENRVQTLEEEMEFKDQTHQEELNSLRNTMETYKITIDRTDGPNDYNDVVRDKLQELRDEFEEEALRAKEELEKAYQAKFNDMRRSNSKDRDQFSRMVEKNNETRLELDRLTSDYNMLEAKNAQLEARLKEFEDLRRVEKEDFRIQINAKNDRISSLEDDLLKLEKEYETLLGIKIALDIEISAYRKMIEGEEERLNLSSPGESRSRKREHGEEGSLTTEVENMTAGTIEVEECDTAGKFVRIKNTSDEDIGLGGWCIHRTVNGNSEEAKDYRFTPKFVLKSGKSVTIWSQSSGVKQKPPNDLVLKTGDWNFGKTMVTSVLDASQEILAQQTMKQVTSPRRARKKRSGTEQESCHLM